MADPSSRVIEIYCRHAAVWVAARGTVLIERTWVERFADQLEQCATVLDLGCGSGRPIAAYFVERGYPVFGVDSSPEMIARFRANLPNESAVVCDMRSLKLHQRFGGLIAWDSFFHLTHQDQRQMFGMHLRDLIGVGLVDNTWPSRFFPPLRGRLESILADPEG